MCYLLAESAKLSQPEMWLLIALGAVGVIYIAVLRPMTRRKDPLDRSPAFTSLAQQRSVERQMQNLLVELSDMSRQVSAQLDTRARKLELLIKDADEKLRALRSAVVGTPMTQVPDSTAQAADDMPDPRHAEVYALADQGRDACEIAARLGRPAGEVELILALRGKG